MGSDQRRAEEHSPARYRDRAVAHARIDAAYDSRTAAAIAGSDVLYDLAVNTDITRTWRRYGWVPPSELPEYHAKWARAKEPTQLRGMSHGRL